MNSDNLVNTGKGVDSELKNNIIKTSSLFLYVVSVLNNEALGGSYFRFYLFWCTILEVGKQFLDKRYNEAIIWDELKDLGGLS